MIYGAVLVRGKASITCLTYRPCLACTDCLAISAPLTRVEGVVLFRQHIWLSRCYLVTCLACTGPWSLALGSTNELTDPCVIPATMKSPTVGDFSAGGL